MTEMLKLTLRTLNANKIRLALTTFAVVLGVSFVVSSLVLGDGLRNSFGSLSEEIVGGTDLQVQPVSDFGTAQPLDASLLTAIEEIDGVHHAAGQVVADNIQPIRADGTPVSTVGPPLLGFSWVDDPALSGFTVVDGRAPDRGLEFTIDEDAAAANDMRIGETYGIVTPTGRFEMELVGMVRFGESNATLGAVLSQFPLETAQNLFNRSGQFDVISVAYDEAVDREAVQAAITAVLPAQVAALDQAQLLDDAKADFNSGVNIFNNILLGFAGVALFVSIFIIANTFAIVLGQRTKELALLRAIGASPAQVRRSTLLEALIVGLVASALGILGGLGLNYGLRAMFEALGADLPESALILAPRTIVVAFAVGVGVTFLSALAPARKAARVAPIAAMQDSLDAPRQSDKRRNLVGAALMVGGITVGSFGLFGTIDGTVGRIAVLAAGAVLTFVGLALACPAVAHPIIGSIGLPLRILGTAGDLSTQNAGRNPRRTASTAASLMVGLALVTMAMVVGESIKQSISDTLASEVRADYIVSSDGPINSALISDLTASGLFSAVSGYRYDEIQVDGVINGVMAGDVEATDRLFDLGITTGQLTNDPFTVAVYGPEADEKGVEVGDQLEVMFPSGATETLTVSAIFDSSTIVDDNYFISIGEWDRRFGQSNDWWAAALLSEGVSSESASASLAGLEAKYPQVGFESQAEFRRSIESQIDQMLVAINAMLVLAIIIALIGIANTLALSVFERAREIGLLRAVGMSRRQTRQMIRWEAALVALFGSVLGISVGLLFGWGAVTALPDSLVSTLAFPFSRISILVAVCGLSGLLAASFPARRASRLNVLDAISHA
ncbi:MAG: ABC transporter permease [Acidimicrobiales bacterium]|nr:ABC transporter permease [Acidimicrobiales bacterium]